MITIRIEGTKSGQGTTMVGQHIQMLLAKEGYMVEFVSSEHSTRNLAERMDYLQSSAHLRTCLSALPVRIVDYRPPGAKKNRASMGKLLCGAPDDTTRSG